MSNWNSKPRPTPPKKSAFIEHFEHKFNPDMDDGGGCETCGFGAEQGMSYEAFTAMLKEMDQWINDRFHQSSGDQQ